MKNPLLSSRTSSPSSYLPGGRSKRGFTLLEIMMVVIIIGLLVGAAVKMMTGNLGIAQDTRVKADVDALSTQLKLYAGINGFLPTTAQGLDALVNQPSGEPRPREWRQFMDKVPLDPWGTPYNYAAPGTHNPKGFDVWSSGPDRTSGTGDDLGNWDRSPTGN